MRPWSLSPPSTKRALASCSLPLFDALLGMAAATTAQGMHRTDQQLERAPRGRTAKRPWQVPWVGWKDVLWRVYQEVEDDNILDLAAAVAFFGLLALFPALIATVSMYGVLADPGDVIQQVSALSVAVPLAARELILGQLDEIGKGSS